MRHNAVDILCTLVFLGSVSGLLWTIANVNDELHEMRLRLNDMELEVASLREDSPRPLSFDAKKELEEIENDILLMMREIPSEFTLLMPKGDYKVITDFYCEHNKLMPERLDQYCPDAFTIVPGSERMFP